MSAPFLRLEDVPASGSLPTAVAIGVFDGVHRGHQALLAETVTAAKKTGAVVTALTFDPHPATIFASPSFVPPLLSTLPERADQLRYYGAEKVIVARFDHALATQTPEEFVQSVLCEKLRARAVVIGEDFRYGRNRAGDTATLRSSGEKHGFAVHVLPSLQIDGTPVRSTIIRQLLTTGTVEEAAQLLGRPYQLEGMVVKGKQLGRTLGYPTANVQSAPEVLVPGAGVYAGRVHVEGNSYRAAISIGTNPTVSAENARTVEAFLMDGFSGDLYEKHIAVEFVNFLRGMEKFDSLDALVQQMANDVREAERLL